ncbi:MAG: hypothetical protein Q7S21_02330 [archaeon]|nr:hypothetical protein [archaeon]
MVDKLWKKDSTISETKCTCRACGNVWHYRKNEELSKRAQKSCSNCGFKSYAGGQDLTENCPKCNSKNFSCEDVKYEIPKEFGK